MPADAARRGWLRHGLGLGLAGLGLGAAQAALPTAYQALQVEPQVQGPRWLFDLDPALAQARAQGKRLYVYLGATDCGYCRRYEAFLQAQAATLVPHFARDWLIVEMRSQLKVTAPLLHLKLGGEARPYVEFQKQLGDERTRMLVYPTVWLLGADGKPLMQMPTGTGTFETVAEQLEILRLES